MLAYFLHYLLLIGIKKMIEKKYFEDCKEKKETKRFV